MTKIKLKQWANLAEIIGALAVVVSLVYVGIQVNDSAGAVRSSAANDVNVALQTWYMEVGADQQTSTIVYRGLMSEQALPEEKEFQFLMMLHGFFLGAQNSYLMAVEGTIDEELVDSLTVVIIGINNLPGMKRYWRQRKSYLHAGFAEWVEQILAQGGEETMDLYRRPNDQGAEMKPE